MTIIADSGSTKTDWCIINDTNQRTTIIHTQGINPYHQSVETIKDILVKEFLPALEAHHTINDESDSSILPHSIEFYGAGCTKEKSLILKDIISSIFPCCNNIIVDSDLLGAAKALCNDSEGIACILGTGANSCLYDGRKIVSNVSPMGYILGDEGSGAVIGKTFINALYKGQHRDFISTFERETSLSQADIIQKVYREPLPNRFLASLCPFISKYIDEVWIEELVIECFRDFFRKNISHYNRRDLAVNFVGSIAHYFNSQLQKAAHLEGFKIGRIVKAPLCG